MSFDAGALIFKIQSQGAQVFKQDLAQADQSIQKVSKSADGAASKLSHSGDALEKTGKSAKAAAPGVALFAKQVSDHERELTTFGTVVTGVGAAFAATTALTAKAAVDWETAWTGVTKTVDGTPEQLDQIEQGLRGLTGVLPASHDEIAAVAEAAGQLGVQTDSIVDFTKTMIDLGETTNLSADEAATSIAQLMNIMQTAPDDVDNLGSALVALGNNGASTERDIIQMAQRIAGAGKTVGLSEDQVLGFANALASVGINAEAGGSALSRIMTDMAMDVSKGGEDLQKWADVAGMSAEQFAKSFKEDPADAIATFIEGLGKVDAAGGDVFATLEDLGQSDVRTSQALLGMANSGDVLRKSLEQGADAWEENNALAEEAAKRYETVQAKLQIAGNSIVDAAIDLGQVFLPIIADGAEIITDIAQGFSDLDPTVQGLIASLIGLIGFVGLTGGAFLLALPKIAEYRAALITLSKTHIPGVSAAATGMMTATNKAGKALRATAQFMTSGWGIAAAAVVAGAMLIGDYLDSLQASASEVENSLKTASDSADIFATLSEGKEIKWLRDVNADLEDMSGMLNKVASQDANWWERLTTETMGFRDAVRQAGESLADMAADDLPSAQKAFRNLVDGQDLSQQQLMTLLDTMPDYRDALIEQATAQGIQVEGLSDARRAMVLVKLAQGEVKSSSEEAVDAYQNEADKVKGLVDELTKLIDTMNEANGVGQDAVSQNINYQQTLDDVAKQIEEINKGTEGYSKTLDTTTQAGRDNMDMLNGLAEDSQSAAQSQYELNLTTMSAKDAMELYIQRLKDGRQKLIDSAMAMGATKDEAVALADKIYKIPSEKEIEVLLDAAHAKEELDYFTRNRNVRVTVDVHTGATGIKIGGKYVTAPEYADGAVVDYFAGGGFSGENHVAQIERAGNVRVWAEPETGGEAYIPLSPSKRGRSLDIWAETGRRLGVQGFADGGVTSSAAGSVGSLIGQVVFQNTDQKHVRSSFEELQFQVRDLEGGGRG
ncbi:phage tail tape measure protein [Paramicrobacterium chengjingii]|uniref:Phage tail tape measure protein n=1 Tax=Paramicrobacterium chengjingii TaxID=2769067 RepID=A0ABX6YLM6_9MICO|nr:phage tail tape measure protein [Microbacterium chengjingii]QPZ39697.1 phage tail tape measure protein [Microbacterium chengjingii]